LDGLPLILPSNPHLLRVKLDQLAQARNIHLNVAVEIDSIRLQHEIAAVGGGYAITVGLYPNDATNVASTRIINPQLMSSIVLGTSARRPNTLATREVFRMIVQLAPAALQLK
jgi:hypothetical protein